MTKASNTRLTQLSTTQMDRRSLLRAAAIGVGVATISPLLAACEVDDDDDVAVEPDDDEVVDDDDVAVEPDDDEVVDDDPDDAEGTFGGTITVAGVNPVTTLDIQAIAAGQRMQAQHVFETLLAYGEDYTIGPSLAETWEWDDDGLVLTLGLREDVVFHNGDPMVADDVVASIERYMDVGTRGLVGEMIDDVREIDDSTVEITIEEVDSGLVPILASPLVYLGILPREAIEGKGADELQTEDLIGTGPYAVEQFDPDAELHLRRFDDYYQTDGERDGYGGAKVPYFDRIIFTAVPESGTRVSQLLAGELDVALDLPRPERARLDGDPDVEPAIGGPGGTRTVVFNHNEEWSSDLLFRQAVQAAVDVEEIALLEVGGDEDFLDLNPSLYRRDQEFWWTDVAAETFNQNDPERARELLDEAGYDGEEIIFMYNPASDSDVAIVTHMGDRLEEIGVQVDFQGMDHATLQAHKAEPTGWQIIVDGMSVRLHPADWAATISCETNRAQWCNEEMEAAFDELRVTFDPDDQKPLSDEVQRVHHEDVFAVKFHDGFELNAHRSDIVGFEMWYLERFWGVWRED